jgi:hypothetical protein
MMKINLRNKIVILGCSALLFAIASCSSSPHAIKHEVINNSDRTLKTPDWVLSQKVMSEENGNIIFVYRMNLDGDARPDACVSMARTQAVGEMAKYIKNAVTSSGQVEDLNDSDDPSMSSLTAFLSQGNISGARVTSTYWEQSIEGDSTGMRPVKKLFCAAQVSIDKGTLDRQMKDAINGAPGGNPEVRKKLIEAQKNFIDNVGNQQSQPAVNPT